uniref:Uncharacterized protein n=1 Tax=Arundo donax TaxID=35708 RepID=A0A0A9A8T0_ARUDO
MVTAVTDVAAASCHTALVRLTHGDHEDARSSSRSSRPPPSSLNPTAGVVTPFGRRYCRLNRLPLHTLATPDCRRPPRLRWISPTPRSHGPRTCPAAAAREPGLRRCLSARA